jgi:hypothetical protein
LWYIWKARNDHRFHRKTLEFFCRYYTPYQRICIPTDWLGENLHLLPWRTAPL